MPEKRTETNPKPADLAVVDRTLIPVLDQSKYGTKASDCLPNSYAAFFLWWDQSGQVPIPKGKDFDAKAQWIHRELSIRCGTRNNSGTEFEDTRKGIREYFKKYHQDRFKVAMTTIYDISPASLAKHTAGSTATVLCLSTYQGRRLRRSNAGYHAVSLMNVEDDGRIELTTWGIHLKGKMTPMPEEDIPRNARFPRGTPRVIYEIVFDPDCEFPDWFKKNNYRFLVDPSNYSCLEMLTVRESKPAK